MVVLAALVVTGRNGTYGVTSYVKLVMTGFDPAVVVPVVPPEEPEEAVPVEPEPLADDELIELEEPDALDAPPPLAEEEEDDEPEDAVEPALAEADDPVFFLVVLPLALLVAAAPPWLSPVPPAADPP